MRQASCFVHYVHQTRCIANSLVINILMLQDTVDMLHELKEEFALTVKQAKANIFIWKAHIPALYQPRCCKGRRSRATRRVNSFGCLRKRFSKRGIFLCMSALPKPYLDLVFFSFFVFWRRRGGGNPLP